MKNQETNADQTLYRIKNHQAILGGVSQGLAEYFNKDVTLIRVIFVVLFFTPVPAFIAYLILWVVLPVKYTYNFVNSPSYNSSNDSISQTGGEPPLNSIFMNSQNPKKNFVGGAVLIILGIIFSFKTFFHISLFHYIGQIWPLILIGIGIWLIVKNRNDDNFTNNDTGNDTGSNL